VFHVILKGNKDYYCYINTFKRVFCETHRQDIYSEVGKKNLGVL